MNSCWNGIRQKQWLFTGGSYSIGHTGPHLQVLLEHTGGCRASLDAFLEENLIVFAACTRGLLEACADSWHSLNPVAPTLASVKSVIAQALKEDLNEVITAKEIEDELIHFTFARRPSKGEILRENHAAQTVAEYLRALELAQPAIREFYAKLCDVVHPGASSVVSFATALDQKAATVVLTFEREPQVLAEFAVGFRIMLGDIMATGFSLGMLILRTLNALPANEVHTPFLESVSWTPSPAWERIESLLAAGQG
jgi:hypothetical protein